jgi:uncharacterized protein (DUF58 family)
MRRFAPFLLLLFAIAAILRTDLFFTIVYLLFAVYFLSHLWMRHATSRLDVQRRFADHALCGDLVTVDVRVRNTSLLPIPWLEIHESLPLDLTPPPFYREVTSLGPRERQGFQYTLHCRKRGYYPIGPLTMQSGDLLGITPRSTSEIAPAHIVVYPRILPLQKLGLSTHSPLVALPARTPLFEDPARIMGVRDYQRGDSPRRIHWTATARLISSRSASAGHLLVKRYQPAIARETLICLDLNREAYGQRQRYTATELAIVAAASVASHIATREKLPVGLATEAFDPLANTQTRLTLPPRRERAHLTSLLEVLARAQIADTTPFEELLRHECVNLSWGATVLAITGSESAGLLDILVHLRQAGFAVALILVQPSRPSAELQGRADLLGVGVHRVWQERDLEAVGL